MATKKSSSTPDATTMAHELDAIVGSIHRLANDFAQDGELCESSRTEDIGELLALAWLAHRMTKDLSNRIDSLESRLGAQA